MKRLLTLLLAAAMVLSVGSITASAATVVDYPVSHIWRYGYLLNDDGYLDMNTKSNYVAYGETIYYPLINTNADSYDNGSSDATAKKTAYETAETAYNNAVTAEETALANKEAADRAFEAAKTALENGSSNPALITALGEAAAIAENLEAKQGEVTRAEGSLGDVNSDLTNWGNRVTMLEDYTAAYISTALDAYYADGADTAAQASAVNMVNALNTINSGSLSLGSYTLDNIDDAKSAVGAAVTAANTLCSNTIGSSGDAADKSGTLYARKNYWTAEISTLEGEAATLAGSLKTKLGGINSTYSLSLNTNETDPDTIEGWKTTHGNTPSSALQNAFNAAQEAKEQKDQAYGTAVQNTKDKLDAKNNAYDAWQAALGAVKDTYVFVYESSAVANAKIKSTWDVGKKYVDTVKFARVKAISTTYGLGTTFTGGKRNIYCIAVTMEESNSTNDAEVEGEVGISKSGTYGFSYSDTSASVSVTVTFPEAASGNHDIPTTPTLFSAGNGFKAEDDHEFNFEDDNDSYFEVNTTNQKDIVLAFDTDYDDDIADMINKKYPNANLSFYNGNYAKFSKTGTLYLAYPEEDGTGYVYSISSSGNLTRVSADYDEYDETFSIRTNTLGRYVISDTKLSSIGTTTTSSSSSTASSVKSSVVASTTSKVSTTTPASSTKPVSSSTASKPSSSSTASSSSSESESSEPLSVKEPSSEDEDEFESVIVNTEDEDNVPTKKGGISWLVWVLILAGLVAVLVAVGVIFYTKKNSGRRML